MLNVIVINSFLVFITVYIHYEVLSRLSIVLPKIPCLPRFRVAIGMLGAICAHVLEVWIYAAAYYFMTSDGNYGHLVESSSANRVESLLDCAYFSFTTYSSLGYGDVVPFNNLRFVAGLEALIGLVMITWSASFMYLEMARFWEKK
ncbi:MAG: two pore domain potassium channel family protein [Pseudomonadales bacterium]|nr:two pore domain potassium channel family protein [Pseudomonadales bacterium]MCP5171831.1 two pore domain potassium channel family protein [Pseudomonadales bacterium]